MSKWTKKVDVFNDAEFILGKPYKIILSNDDKEIVYGLLSDISDYSLQFIIYDSDTGYKRISFNIHEFLNNDFMIVELDDDNELELYSGQIYQMIYDTEIAGCRVSSGAFIKIDSITEYPNRKIYNITIKNKGYVKEFKLAKNHLQKINTNSMKVEMSEDEWNDLIDYSTNKDEGVVE
ncbi:hypothetical protein Goe21_01900 [Bacillus phage vB_BsuM-Goe21]|nr:hypothetical protein Goe21_01900 [Bacillus phage vB_BsuM-Goe21]